MISSACLRVAAVLSAITLFGSSLCRADDRLWAAVEGEYSGELSGSASASLGLASTVPAGQTQEEQARMRAEAQARLLERLERERAANPRVTATLSVRRREPCSSLSLKFANVPSDSGLRDIEAEFGGNPAGGVLCGQPRSPAQNDFARAMLTDRALVLLQAAKATVAGPWVVQVHLRADDSGVEMLYWATAPDGKQTKGWSARLRRK